MKQEHLGGESDTPDDGGSPPPPKFPPLNAGAPWDAIFLMPDGLEYTDYLAWHHTCFIKPSVDQPKEQ